jgi:hypothetical protein
MTSYEFDETEIKSMSKGLKIFTFMLIKIISMSLWWIILLSISITLILKILLNKIFKILLFVCEKILHYSEKLFKYNNSRVCIVQDRKGVEPYLMRYYLFIKERSNFPFNIFIHKFLKSDEEDVHDHPWSFFHIIISGGYWEHLPEDNNNLDLGFKKIWREPGHYKYVDASYIHRVELARDKNDKLIQPWTIFIPFKQKFDWGFWIKSNDEDKNLNKKLSNISWSLEDKLNKLKNYHEKLSSLQVSALANGFSDPDKLDKIKHEINILQNLINNDLFDKFNNNLIWKKVDHKEYLKSKNLNKDK